MLKFLSLSGPTQLNDKVVNSEDKVVDSNDSTEKKNIPHPLRTNS